MLTKINIVAALLLSSILSGLIGWSICTFTHVDAVTSISSLNQEQEIRIGEVAAGYFITHPEELIVPCFNICCLTH